MGKESRDVMMIASCLNTVTVTQDAWGGRKQGGGGGNFLPTYRNPTKWPTIMGHNVYLPKQPNTHLSHRQPQRIKERPWNSRKADTRNTTTTTSKQKSVPPKPGQHQCNSLAVAACKKGKWICSWVSGIFPPTLCFND